MAIIGEEIIRTIFEFFVNGRLLKQINATLLALIPKVQSPATVADFRPISCCNVLYKAISIGYNQRRLPKRCAMKVDLRKGECVTTSSFFVSLNNNIHSFFQGSRGLRQGDPMSPYLFVLVQELNFADNLPLISNVDETSVGVFKRGLQLFASLSGLCANPDKSQLIISKSALNNHDMLL
ncbi:hypothetical protein Sango_1586800 [Sesamum angolense]|uniref:Reverse transcriptase domain-containing protein n=1 Tax=Sesamum angolense TaxID=2727404 RepID=A0AAE2BTU2_9LAMI|nr:hypothetical protein Sango_1586800 [Sesamum angolense]